MKKLLKSIYLMGLSPLLVIAAHAQPNLLVAGGFEGITSANLTSYAASSAGVWGAENAAISGTANGITPIGSQMMLLKHAGGGTATQVNQSVYGPFKAGSVVTFSVKYNTWQAPSAYSSQLAFVIVQTDSGLSLTGTRYQSPGVALDTDTSTWQTVTETVILPADTNYISTEIALSMTSSLGYYGMPLAYVDDAVLTVVPPSVSAPVISVPANISTNATSVAGAPVTFSASATSKESLEIFRRATATGESWQPYSKTFVSGVTGTFTLGFNVVSATNGDNSIFIDAVKVVNGATTLLSDGFEPPASGNTTQDVSTPATLGSNWYFNNYGGILQPPTGWAPWGSIANGTPPEGSQFAVIRDVVGVQSKMTSVGQISLVAGQTYTLSFDQASREIFGGALTYTVTLERQISVPVSALPASGSTFPVGTSQVNLSATTNGGTTTGLFYVTVNTIPVTITLGNLTQTYDGTAKSASATTSPSGIPVSLGYTGANLPPVNAASYGVLASVSSPYTGTASGTLNITKAPVTFTLGNLSQTYDGTAKSISVISSPAGVAYTVTYSGDHTNAGNCTVQVDSNSPNYSGSTTGTLVINKAPSTTLVTINGAPFTYSGSAQTPATVSVTGAGGLSLAPTASYTNNTSAGTATASYTYSGDTNHTGSSDSKNFTIGQATPLLSWSTPAAIISGTELDATQLNATANIPGTFTYSPAAGTNLAVGIQNLSATFLPTDTTNYVSGSTIGTTITVNPVIPTTTISAPVIAVPADITTFATSGAGAAVTFGATATSNISSEVYRRTTVSAEPWKAYSVTFKPTISGNFKLRFRTVADDGTDNTFFIDDVHVINNATNAELFASGFEQPTVNDSYYPAWDWQNGHLFSDVAFGDWTFTNYAGVIAGNSGSWGGSGPQAGAQRGYVQSFYGQLSNVTSATAFSLVAGQTYTVKYYQATRIGYPDNLTYAVTLESTESNTVTAAPASGSTFPVGTTTVGLSATNSVGATSTGSFNVTVNKVHADIALSNLSQTYDGTQKSPTATTSPVTGINVVINFVGNPINAGSYDFTATISDPMYTGSTTGVLVINKAPSSTVVTINGGPFTYNGSAQTPATVSVTGVGGLNQTATATYANNINAGTATASYSYPGDANHTASSDSKDFTIGKAVSTTVVTINGGPFTYNGSALTPATVSVTGVGGLNLTPAAVYANNTNAGSATASYAFAGDNNYIASSDSKTFTIDQAPSTTIVTINGGPFTYTGSALTPATVSVTGAGGLNLTPTAVYVNNTNAGSATASYSFSGDANHTASGDSKGFTINKADARLSVAGYSGVYDGAAHGATGTATGVGAANVGSFNLGATFTNAPGGTANWTFSGGQNYNDASGSAAIVIAKANPVVVVNAYTAEYDGAPHSATVSSITGVNGESGATVGVVTLNSTHTAIGTYSDSWSFAGAANYNSIAATPITDKIVDTTAPAVTVSLVPLRGGGDDESAQFFTVVFSATDLAGVTTLTASLNGVTVTNGQVVQLQTIKSGAQSVKRDDGKLQIKATSFLLTVTAADAAGNKTTVTAVPVFVKNGKDSEDKKSDDKSSSSSSSSSSKSNKDK